MPIVECADCGKQEKHTFERIESDYGMAVRKPYLCPNCVDYAEQLEYHELRGIVGAQGISIGSNPTTDELINALRKVNPQ